MSINTDVKFKQNINGNSTPYFEVGNLYPKTDDQLLRVKGSKLDLNSESKVLSVIEIIKKLNIWPFKSGKSLSRFQFILCDLIAERLFLSLSKKSDMGQATRSPVPIKQYQINSICSGLWLCKIYTRQDLIDHFDKVMKTIFLKPNFFEFTQYKPEEQLEIFECAITAYNKVNPYKISLLKNDVELLGKFAQLDKSKILRNPKEIDDLSRVTQNYDRLKESHEKIRITTENNLKIIKDSEFAVCPHVILGAGDTGTTLWLERYKSHHGEAQEKLSQGQLPGVLMIGETLGSWRCNYTLAQRYSLLERGCVVSNPSDYMSKAYYLKNPYANARHIYQANVVSLAETKAPLLLGAQVIRIQKNSGQEDWKSKGHTYRIKLGIPAQGIVEKEIYTNEIDICTGLGQPRNGAVKKCIPQGFKELSQYDSEKKIIPIIDGDQFILAKDKEVSSPPRTIVVYGGGGTAAACYRKAFFGHDTRTDLSEYEEKKKKNSVKWIAKKGFQAAGKGKLATKALASAEKSQSLFAGELVQITHNSGKLTLIFEPYKSANSDKNLTPSDKEILCDQLVYALGQQGRALKKVCRTFTRKLQLTLDNMGMPSLKTKDHKIHFFGAALMATRKRQECESIIWKWLKKQKIGPDVGPGSMPGSRAQIKYISQNVDNINVSIDDSELVRRFLDQCGVEQEKISSFIDGLLKARDKGWPSSVIELETLQGLLSNHKIDDKVKIQGLSHLVKK